MGPWTGPWWPARRRDAEAIRALLAKGESLAALGRTLWLDYSSVRPFTYVYGLSVTDAEHIRLGFSLD